MGQVRSFFSIREYLYSDVEAAKYARVRELLKKHPSLINQPLTNDCRSTALVRAAWRNDLKMVQLLL